MSIIIPANSAVAGGYDVANSCRFDGSSSYLQKTYANSQNKTFSISTWVKRSELGDAGAIWSSYHNATNYLTLAFKDDDALRFQNVSAGVNMNFTTNRLFRDVSAWMHILAIVDTTDGTAGDRQQIFINGVRETSFSTSTAYALNAAAEIGATDKENIVGRHGSGDDYFDGYMAEHVFIDGLALEPDSFGEFDEDSGIFKPIDVSGLTFGTNGYYLDFEDSSNLGNDANGGTDLSENGLAATDQATDTCTNNFATLNFVDNYYPRATLSEGNLLQVSDTFSGTTTGEVAPNTSTIGVSSGKWYAEMKYVSTAQHSYGRPGITSNQNGPANGTSVLGSIPGSWGMFLASGSLYNGNGDTSTSYGSEVNVGDIVGMYMDLDNNKLYYADNGTLVSSTGISITAAASTNLGAYFFGNSDESRNTATFGWNFGGCSAFTVSSGNTDVNGYGNFEYDPSSGTFDGASKDFLAVCTKNLAEHG